MSRRRLLLLTLLLIFASAMIVMLGRRATTRTDKSKQRPAEAEVSPAASTIESSGHILGVGIGSSLEEARQKLDPVRAAGSAELREKETGEGGEGKRAYWRLEGTEYSWIMVWSNKEGRIVQLSASVRPEKPKPFEEVGDLENASTNLEAVAIWNVARPNNLSYRLVARGPNRRATNIYMTATALERQ